MIERIQRENSDQTSTMPEYEGFLCIAAVNTDSVKLHYEKIIKNIEALKIATKEISMVASIASATLQDSITNLLEYDIVQNNPSVPITTSNNMMISLLAARQLIESAPMLKYLAQSTIDQLGINITLPTILDNNLFLIATHFSMGYAAAQLLSIESINKAGMISNIDSSIYVMRLTGSGYLNALRQDFEFTKYCSATMLVHILPNVATCIIAKLL